MNESKPDDPKLNINMPSLMMPAPDWSQHEHVSDQVQLEAAKLVELVGSAELAKHAINIVEQNACEASNNKPESQTGGSQ